MVSDHLDVDQENDASSMVGKYDFEFGKIDFGVVETELQIHILYFPDFQEKMMPAVNKITNKLILHYTNTSISSSQFRN